MYWNIGFPREEFIPQLMGLQGLLELERMWNTDETIGAMMWLIETTITQIEWKHEPQKNGKKSDDPAALQAAEFADTLLLDMGRSWQEHVEEALSMIPLGFAPCEIVLKQRDGVNSRYDDKLWGLDDLPLRDQASIFNWIYSGRDLVGMRQVTFAGSADIPMWKLCNYRIKSYLNKPVGRALDPETPIPTPDGWRRMDDLQPGDKVFDEEGKVRYVVARRDWEDRPTYRVKFSGGHEILADENHEWWTLNRAERNHRCPGKIRTTKEIAEKVRCDDGIVNHSIPWAGSLDYPEQLLPLDPYFLGLWLGDGDSNGARIACHLQDLEETVALIEGCGFQTKVDINGGSENGRSIKVYGSVRWGRDGPTSLLTTLGLIKNKHIPQAYLRGSIGQRMALLSGLMDSDGFVAPGGTCEFTNTNYSLAIGVTELVRSLGIGAYIRAGASDHGTPKWRVTFTPDFVPFRLSRKAARCKPVRARKFHYIEEVTPVEPRRTVCIQVDSPSHLFLAGEAMIPTHNSLFYSAYRIWRLKVSIQDSEAIGIERDLCGLPTFEMPLEDIEIAGRTVNNDGKTPTPEALQAMGRISAAQKAVRDMRYNRSGGLVVPSDTYEGDDGKPSTVRKYALKIVTTAGQRSIDTRTAIRDYDRGIARTAMMQFLHLGDRAGGSNGLSDDQSTLAINSLQALANKIATTFTRSALSLVWRVNAMDPAFMPALKPGNITKEGMQQIGAFLQGIGKAWDLFSHDPGARVQVMKTIGVDTTEEAQAFVPPTPAPTFGKSPQENDNEASGNPQGA